MLKDTYTPPQTWHLAGQYFQFKEKAIFYRDEGQGPLLLCIHGFPTSSWDWQYLWPVLTQHFRVLAPDMLGFGFSDKPARHVYSIHEQADLHEALLAQLGLSEGHLLAHDYGDTVAQELLARHETRKQTARDGFEIQSLVLLNGGIFPEMHRPRRVQKLLEGPFGFLLSALFTEKRFQKGFCEVFGPESLPSMRELQDFWDIITYQNGHRLGHRLIRYMADRRQHRDRWVNALVATQVPRMLINGPEDPVSGLHAAERYQQLIPSPQVVLLAGIGHYPQTEAPDAVWEAFRAFHQLA
ncbi:MAG: alpha/beta hydrolase [Microscillaceae bacterium]|nr:alpha/beta hydrolase [Microscillaceae bacterium]